jgi:hypothetical protein
MKEQSTGEYDSLKHNVDYLLETADKNIECISAQIEHNNDLLKSPSIFRDKEKIQKQNDILRAELSIYLWIKKVFDNI